MPAGKPWRTGADEATVLKTDKALKFGTLSLEPGHLHAEHGSRATSRGSSSSGKLGKPGQWGIPYNAALEIGRVAVPQRTAKAPIEQVTIFESTTPRRAVPPQVENGARRARRDPFTVG